MFNEVRIYKADGNLTKNYFQPGIKPTILGKFTKKQIKHPHFKFESKTYRLFTGSGG